MPPEIKPPSSAEIEQALRERKMKSQAGSVPVSPGIPPPPRVSGTSEIDQALKQFEVESGTLQAPRAELVPKAPGSDLPKMVQLVMKLSGGTIKEQKTAEYVLLGIAVLAFSLSFYFFFKALR